MALSMNYLLHLYLGGCWIWDWNCSW